MVGFISTSRAIRSVDKGVGLMEGNAPRVWDQLYYWRWRWQIRRYSIQPLKLDKRLDN